MPSPSGLSSGISMPTLPMMALQGNGRQNGNNNQNRQNGNGRQNPGQRQNGNGQNRQQNQGRNNGNNRQNPGAFNGQNGQNNGNRGQNPAFNNRQQNTRDEQLETIRAVYDSKQNLRQTDSLSMVSKNTQTVDSFHESQSLSSSSIEPSLSLSSSAPQLVRPTGLLSTIT